MNHTEQILEISKKLGLSHIGSNLSVLPILEGIYEHKKPQDRVILDNAHAHLAHLLFISDFPINNIETFGIHCDRRAGCDASGGSLGHGIGIGIGMALANPEVMVNVIVSDGSMMEGSNWEALRLIGDLKVKNIMIHCNFNGVTAVAEVSPLKIYYRMEMFTNQIKLYETSNTEEFDGVQGHYKTI